MQKEMKHTEYALVPLGIVSDIKTALQTLAQNYRAKAALISDEARSDFFIENAIELENDLRVMQSLTEIDLWEPVVEQERQRCKDARKDVW